MGPSIHAEGNFSFVNYITENEMSHFTGNIDLR